MNKEIQKQKVQKKIGQLIATFIEKRGIKNTFLADKMQLNRGSITHLIHGNKPLNLHEVMVIADVLNIEVKITSKCIEFIDLKDKN